LEKTLSERWEMPVHCHIHTAEIREENVREIIFGYLTQIRQMKNSNLLLDITHGFRSMPVLLMSTLQTQDALLPEGIGLEIIYGEYRRDEPSPVRYLKPVWDQIRFARALRLFRERFDGALLAEHLESSWKSGSKAVLRVTEMIQANFVTKFDEALAQLGNALKELDQREKVSSQDHLVAEELRNMHQRLTRPQFFHLRLLALAELLAESRLWGQAVTALQLALEAYLFHFYEDNRYGDYEATKELLQQFGSTLARRDREYFHRLRSARNAIAHGGARSTRGGLPQEGNLPGQFSAYRDFLKRIYQ
jgi:CRISPR-associated DxTHG motif protein